MFEKIIKYFSVFSIGIFILSYAYLDGYYSSFHINIINYITTSEIFYAILPLVVIILSGGMGAIQGYIFPSPKKPLTPQIDEKASKTKWFNKKWIHTLLPYLISLSAGIGFFINANHFGYRQAPLVNGLTFIFLVGAAGYPAVKTSVQNFGFTPYLQVFLFVVAGYVFIQYGKDTAKVNKLLGNKDNIQFKYHNKLFITNDKLILLGETQSTIFLYFKANNTSLVLPRSTIDSLVIDNSK